MLGWVGWFLWTIWDYWSTSWQTHSRMYQPMCRLTSGPMYRWLMYQWMCPIGLTSMAMSTQEMNMFFSAADITPIDVGRQQILISLLTFDSTEKLTSQKPVWIQLWSNSALIYSTLFDHIKQIIEADKRFTLKYVCVVKLIHTNFNWIS